MRRKRRNVWLPVVFWLLFAAALAGFCRYMLRDISVVERVRYVWSSDRTEIWREAAEEAGFAEEIEEYYYGYLTEEEKEVYRELYVRLMRYEDSADLYSQIRTDDFWKVYYSVLNDHPEIFWIGTGASVSESSLTGRVVRYEVETTVPPEEREEMKLRLDQAVEDCMAWLWPEATEYEKIKTVYEYLINQVDYDINAPDSQNVQSALLYHRSVCAGYSRAFQFILHRLGLFCTYLTGSTRNGGDHGWNMVRIDGRYYYVDVTWGDPVFVREQEGTASGESDVYMNYDYLCCTSEELFRTHIPSDSVELPDCNSDDYDYYKMQGLYYETFDRDLIYTRLMDSVTEGDASVVMKFGSEEAYKQAKTALFEEHLLQDAAQILMNRNGVRTWNYRYHLNEDFYVISLYW